MKTTLYELIQRSAQAALQREPPDFAMRAGHKGPRVESEAPVRNTNQWPCASAKAHEASWNLAFRDTTHEAADYLSCDRADPSTEAGPVYEATRLPEVPLHF